MEPLESALPSPNTPAGLSVTEEATTGSAAACLDAADVAKIDISREVHGQASYYYWHTTPSARLVAEPIACAPAAVELVPETIATYSWLDDGPLVKIFVPFPGATSLPAGAIACAFERGEVDLRVTAHGRLKQLRLASLYSGVDVDKCRWRATDKRITIVLAKEPAAAGRSGPDRWSELCRKAGF